MWTSFVGLFCLPQFRWQVTPGLGLWMPLGQRQSWGQQREKNTIVCSGSLNRVQQPLLYVFTIEAGLTFIPQTDLFPRPWLRCPPPQTAGCNLWTFPGFHCVKPEIRSTATFQDLHWIWTLLFSKLNLNIQTDKDKQGFLGSRKPAPGALIG